EKEQTQSDIIALQWYLSKFQKVLTEIEDHYSKYRISDALMATYKLIWDDFCSWLLEMVKPPFGEKISEKTYLDVISTLEDNLKVLHPFVPFISEEIWQHITQRDISEALIISEWPKPEAFDDKIIKDFEFASEVISGIRNIRKEKNISFKDTISLSVLNNDNASKEFDAVISKLGNISSLNYISE